MRKMKILLIEFFSYRSALLFIKKRLHLPVPICSLFALHNTSASFVLHFSNIFFNIFCRYYNKKNPEKLFKSFAAGIEHVRGISES